MAIRISIPGASSEEITRGVLAAQQVFDQSGVTDEDAAWAKFDVEGWDIGGFQEPAPAQALDICDLWDKADGAALEACCTGWPDDQRPRTANLELLKVPDKPYRIKSPVLDAIVRHETVL